MIKIIVLNDDRCLTKDFNNEHGLSLYIKTDEKKILFDSGQTDIYRQNAKKLGVDLDDIDCVVLSHGDYDHSNGLKYLSKKVDLICHPDFIKDRISKRTGKYGGIDESKEEILDKFNLIETKNPYFITNNIVFLGEIPRKTSFEEGRNLPMMVDTGDTYSHLDDSALVIKTDDGIVVVAGCSHSGICNIVTYAQEVTKENKVLAVFGGFHLKDIDDQMLNTIEYMKRLDINNVYLGHCTADAVCGEFAKELKDKAIIISTGETYNL